MDDPSLDDRIAQAISGMVSNNAVQNGLTSPTPGYLSCRQVAGGFGKYIFERKEVATELVAMARRVRLSNDAIESKADLIDRLMYQAVLEYLISGDYYEAWKMSTIGSHPDMKALHLEIYKTGVGSPIVNVRSTYSIVQHYINTHAYCRLLSGAEDCREKVKANVAIERGTIPYIFRVEGSCINSEHSFIGEITSDPTKITAYKPLSVPGERPA
ncbi:MAG TPA: hypothetical protein VJB90_02085 [Candidatus Nanoarchaeia archaeon]|nr:hypothetical protein [Candidatus Nanoarchaeia archaeon]